METQQPPLVAITPVVRSPATLVRATDNFHPTRGEQTDSKEKGSCGTVHAMSAPTSWAEPWYTLLVDDKRNEDTRGELCLADGKNEEAQVNSCGVFVWFELSQEFVCRLRGLLPNSTPSLLSRTDK